MVIPPALYYLFAPFLMGIIGVLADKFKAPKLRDGVAILVSLWGLVSVWMLYNMGIASGDILVFTIGGTPPLGACFEIDLMSIYFAGSAAFLGLLVTHLQLYVHGPRHEANRVLHTIVRDHSRNDRRNLRG